MALELAASGAEVGAGALCHQSHCAESRQLLVSAKDRRARYRVNPHIAERTLSNHLRRFYVLGGGTGDVGRGEKMVHVCERGAPWSFPAPSFPSSL